MKTTLHTILIFLCLSFTSSAQVLINYSGGLTPQQAIDSMLSSSYVNPTNVIWNGNSSASSMVQPNCQVFENISGFPLDWGIYLTTSMASPVSDVDLSTIATGPITNGAVLQFDFEALGDTLVVEYMFASAEYPNFVCSSFNDAFGFFISGPGITGPYSNNAENIALIPNTNTPVAINTVNPGVPGVSGTASYCSMQDPNWVNNSSYYTSLYAGYSGETYNGGTIPMTARIPVQCGEIYTIKFTVANVSDQALNSGVYISKCKFPNVCSAQVDYQGPNNMSETIEGCRDGGSLLFNRVGCGGNEDQPLTTQLSFSGTAQNGVDYTGVPSSITFAPYQNQIILPLDITDDLIAEGIEQAIITATTTLPSGETVTSETSFSIVDREELITTSHDLIVNCHEEEATIEVIVNQGTVPYSHLWSNGDTTSSILIPLSNDPMTFTVETTDACGKSSFDTITVERNTPLSVQLSQVSTEYCLDEPITFYVSVSEQNATLNWDFGSNVSSGYASSVSSQDTMLICAFTSSTDITVIATNGDAYCNDTTTAQVILATCGCTDPSALNYNPLATIDDGSCQPNKPTVVAPNVFTPFDNHADNNLFFLKTENAKYIHLTILNRWGNVVYEGEGSQNDPPIWNGKNENGKELNAGTYFYTYRVEGYSDNKNENVLVGQGFVELIAQ